MKIKSEILKILIKLYKPTDPRILAIFLAKFSVQPNQLIDHLENNTAHAHHLPL